jgi:two-component system phosphate regulon response regulator OmpR
LQYIVGIKVDFINMTKKNKILVIDDDKKILSLLKKFLEKHEFEVSIVENAEDAVVLIKNNRYDLIILDIMMPRITGIDFAKSIRLDNAFDTPIIMLTALSDKINYEKGFDSGVDEYLTKPFDPKELLARIHDIISDYYQNKSVKQIIYLKDCIYHFETKILEYNNVSEVLSIKMSIILEYLINHSGYYISNKALSIQTGISEVEIQQLSQELQNKIGNQNFKILDEHYVIYT